MCGLRNFFRMDPNGDKLLGWTYDKAHMHAKKLVSSSLCLSISLCLSLFFVLNGYFNILRDWVLVGNIWITLHASLEVCEEATCNPNNHPTSFEGEKKWEYYQWI
jgi:hypothetical protein